jgi:hypothetical protein
VVLKCRLSKQGDAFSILRQGLTRKARMDAKKIKFALRLLDFEKALMRESNRVVLFAFLGIIRYRKYFGLSRFGRIKNCADLADFSTKFAQFVDGFLFFFR